MNSLRKIIVEEGGNATSDFYFSDLAQSSECFSLKHTPEVVQGDKFELVFIRYFSSNWQRWFKENRAVILKARVFIDDDVFDASAWKSLPWRYRVKLWNHSLRWKAWFVQNNVQLAVSTDYLAKKYKSMAPELLHPKPLAAAKEESIVVFYHGSSSHKEDIQFVYQVMDRVLAENANIYFEIIGGSCLNNQFKTLPRTIVVHPMKWDAYKQFNQRQYRHIGLAPLVDTPFNLARSCTKFYDISAAGAVGIYAKNGPYSRVVRDNINGILVDMTMQSWSEAILKLASSKDMRVSIFENAKASLGSGNL